MQPQWLKDANMKAKIAQANAENWGSKDDADYEFLSKIETLFKKKESLEESERSLLLFISRALDLADDYQKPIRPNLIEEVKAFVNNYPEFLI